MALRTWHCARRTLLAAAALLFIAAGGAQGQHDFARVRSHITRVMAERNLASVSVAVASGERILWTESFGLADVARAIAATPDTPYSLASISKPFTATGLMTLVEAGTVRLDAPLNDALGPGRISNGAAPASDASVRRVMSHTAGLPLHYQFFYENEAARPPPMDDAISRHGVVMFPPGAVYEYSNLGYGILGHAAARAAGETYERFMRTRVFQPLGLTRTSVGADPAMAPAIRHDAARKAIPYYTTDHAGASEIYSSARDLVRFGLFHLGHELEGQRAILTRRTRAEMQRPATPPGGPSYGLGWGIADEFGFRKISHTGSMPGVSTELALFPEQDVAIVVLINSLERVQRIEIGREIAAVVIPGFAAARAQAATAAPGGRGEAAGRGTGAGAPAPIISGEWIGSLRTWRGTTSLVLRSNAEGMLLARLGDQPEALVAGARLAQGFLTGRLAATLDAPDLSRARGYSIQLKLRQAGDRLVGQATALSSGEPTLFALSSFVELTRR